MHPREINAKHIWKYAGKCTGKIQENVQEIRGRPIGGAAGGGASVFFVSDYFISSDLRYLWIFFIYLLYIHCLTIKYLSYVYYIFLYLYDFSRNYIPLRAIWKSVPFHSVPFIEMIRSSPQKSVRAHGNLKSPFRGVPCTSLKEGCQN